MIQHRIKEREPQYMDMKEIITEAARKLVLEKKVKKLTVKDIVEECQITRQAFYYHFEGIPDMIQWSIKQGTRRLLEACKEQGGAEAALKYLFVFAINAIPEVRKGIESNYGKELEQTLMQGTCELFESIVEEENLYRNVAHLAEGLFALIEHLIGLPGLDTGGYEESGYDRTRSLFDYDGKECYRRTIKYRLTVFTGNGGGKVWAMIFQKGL